MRIDFIFLKSRVATRIFYLFIICALLPIGLLAYISLHQLSEDQKKQSFQKLHNVSKNIGMSILEGLSFIQSEMQVVALSTNAKLQMPALEKLNPKSGVRNPRLLGLTLFQGQNAVKTFIGEPCPYPKMTASDFGHLSSREGILHIQRLNENSYRMFIIVGLSEISHKKTLLVGEINPEYLWALARGSLPPVTDAYILDSAGTTLFSTSRLSQTAMSEIEKKTEQASVDRLEWHDNDGVHFASHWSIFLRTSIYSDDWKVIVAQTKDEALAAVNRVSKIIGLILVISFLVVLFLSSVQIRRNLAPLARLKEGTLRVSQGDFESRVNVRSGDEFEELAVSFNTMSEQIGRHFTKLSEMNRMITTILTSLNKERIIETVLSSTRKVVSCDAVCLTLMGPEANKALTFFKSDANADTAGIVKRYTTFQSQELQRIDKTLESLDIDSDNEFNDLLSAMKEQRCIRFIILPISDRNRLLGVLTLGYLKQPEEIREDCIRASQIAHEVAIAFSNANLIEELDQLNWGTLTALARTVDAKSPWTAGHSERVTSLSLKIGQALGMTSEELDILHRGGLLHDIGKIGIPSSILNKPAKLTDDERFLIMQHPGKGALILEPIKAYSKAIPAVAQHHEWVNGQGYPKGLKGDDISISARILAVADVYDAMSSDRPYRKGLDEDVVIGYLREKAGLQFDPEVVRVLEKVISAPYGGTSVRSKSDTYATIVKNETIMLG
jgi:putative nucleotidyltransferase with HDIG domain